MWWKYQSALLPQQAVCPFIKIFELVLHKDPSEDDKVSPGLSEPLTGRHMSQIGLDKAQSSRVRPQQGACVPMRECLAAPSAEQHSSVCATNPNEAGLCRQSGSPVQDDLSKTTTERCSEATHKPSGMRREHSDNSGKYYIWKFLQL